MEIKDDSVTTFCNGLDAQDKAAKEIKLVVTRIMENCRWEFKALLLTRDYALKFGQHWVVTFSNDKAHLMIYYRPEGIIVFDDMSGGYKQPNSLMVMEIRRNLPELLDGVRARFRSVEMALKPFFDAAEM